MSSAVADRPQQAPATNATERVITYVPLGAKNAIELTIGMVRRFLCVPTKSGQIPTDADIVKYMMLCKARELDPWVGDAYLTGYDTQDGPQFSLITAVQALFKRAEISPEYDGMESGVIVKLADGTLVDREGDFTLDDDAIVGAWARCHRKDRRFPATDRLKFSTFDTGRSRWKKDPAGMIVKCCEASALRKSFPTQLGGLYTREEMDHLSETRIANRDAERIGPMRAASNLSELAARLEEKPGAQRLQAEVAQQQLEQQQADDEPQAPGPLLRYEAMAAECETVEQIDKGMAAVQADRELSAEQRDEAYVFFAVAKKKLGKK